MTRLQSAPVDQNCIVATSESLERTSAQLIRLTRAALARLRTRATVDSWKVRRHDPRLAACGAGRLARPAEAPHGLSSTGPTSRPTLCG